MRLKELRKARGLTQKDLAEKIGVNESTISRYEKGTMDPTITIVKKLAEVLNVDYYALIDDSPANQINDQPFFSYLERMTFYYNLLNATATKDESIINEVRSLEAISKCELCGKDAPFKDRNGLPYLEIHYVNWLSEGGDPTPSNAVALCPNCHRRIHVLRDLEDKEKLLEVLSLRNR